MKKPTDKLREALADAPAGPWLVRHYPDCAPLIKMATDEIQDLPNWQTAELIVAMHAALPKLLDLAEAVEALRDSAEIKLNTYGDGKAYASYTPHGFGPLVQLMQAITALEQSQ